VKPDCHTIAERIRRIKQRDTSPGNGSQAAIGVGSRVCHSPRRVLRHDNCLHVEAGTKPFSQMDTVQRARGYGLLHWQASGTRRDRFPSLPANFRYCGGGGWRGWGRGAHDGRIETTIGDAVPQIDLGRHPRDLLAREHALAHTRFDKRVNDQDGAGQVFFKLYRGLGPAYDRGQARLTRMAWT